MNLKKVIVAFVAALISSASFIFAVVNVYATEADSLESSSVQARQQITNDVSTEATASEIAEMKFYFEDVGHFNFEDHTYQVTNLEALTQKMQLNNAC
jgi:hypothetical protein